MWKHCFVQIAAGLLVAAGAAFGQAATPSSNPLSFEVASIKPSAPLDPAAIMSGKAHLGMSVDNARVDIGGATLMRLICQAYKIRPNQIVGNPAWLNVGMTDRFDILAKMPEGATKDQVPEMLQSLLADRFKLAVHRETRDTPVYALIVGKGGPKLQEVAPDPPAPSEPTEASTSSGGSSGADDSASSRPANTKREMAFGSGDNRVTVQPSARGAVINTKETGRMRMERSENGDLRMEAESMTMESFVAMLSRFADYPVVDMTQLKGRYKFSFDIPRDALISTMKQMGMGFGMNTDPASNSVPPAQAAADPSGSSLFTSVQELGLKLEKRKLPYDFVVIDHVEKTPTEN